MGCYHGLLGLGCILVLVKPWQTLERGEDKWIIKSQIITNK